MPLINIPVGGSHYAEKQVMNLLRQRVADPGIDLPNASDGTGHGATRDEQYPYTATGDGAAREFTITPPETGAPVAAIYDVYIGTAKQLYGFDYLIQWGDKFGTPDQRVTKIIFIAPPANGSAITANFRYGKRIQNEEGKLVALGSFINTGFSRGMMPLPKIQVTLEEDTLEPVGIGDNWDETNQLGAYWHNIRFRVTIMSLYADETKELTDRVMSSIMKMAHDTNYFMPEIKPERVVNLDYDLDQRAYVRIIQFTCKSREIFG